MPARKPKDPVQEILNKLPPYVRNRYFIALVLFTAWMVFFDRHDVLTQFQLRSTVDRLENELHAFDGKIDRAEAEKQDMESNRERFARESYYMQKDDEDVFIIVDKTKDR
ncbi:FtsB family cell division protein [Neolewinella antarctica]|uniref:Cell division protein FtsB n=1 Tax=Neolewinella antarctica TaxID=442734 RepID=A0ABX0XDM7_9BACT|nr:septum formation initiator family protein [Neolewinella antarctica]NJC27400.1 cell division protein FtsB [Neolewinella antarctica]